MEFSTLDIGTTFWYPDSPGPLVKLDERWAQMPDGGELEFHPDDIVWTSPITDDVM